MQKDDIKNQVQSLFTVIFDDNTYYLGGISYYDTGWLGIPLNKKIKRIFYRLPDGNHLVLTGYSKYFHMIEVVEDITGKNKGKIRIEYAYIMGKKENKVDSYRITLYQNEHSRYKLGDITRREFDINSEKIKKLNPENWR